MDSETSYKTYVKLSPLYGCWIWGMDNNSVIERVDLKFYKILLNC